MEGCLLAGGVVLFILHLLPSSPHTSLRCKSQHSHFASFIFHFSFEIPPPSLIVAYTFYKFGRISQFFRAKIGFREVYLTKIGDYERYQCSITIKMKIISNPTLKLVTHQSPSTGIAQETHQNRIAVLPLL